MIVAEVVEDGETLPATEAESAGTLVSVTVSARSMGSRLRSLTAREIINAPEA